MVAAQLSEMTVAQLREAFDVIDHDRSGSIELHELHAALESIEWSGREELGRIFEEMDTDKSGTIEFDEFLVTAAMAQDLASASQTVAVDLPLLLTAYAQRLILERRLNATETPSPSPPPRRRPPPRRFRRRAPPQPPPRRCRCAEGARRRAGGSGRRRVGRRRRRRSARARPPRRRRRLRQRTEGVAGDRPGAASAQGLADAPTLLARRPRGGAARGGGGARARGRHLPARDRRIRRVLCRVQGAGAAARRESWRRRWRK